KAEEAEEAGYFAQAEEYFNELGDYSDAKIRAMMASHYALKSEIWPSDTKKISKIEADFEKLLEHSDDDDRIKELLGDDLFHYVKLTGTWLNKNGKTAFILSIKKGHYSLEIWPSAPMKWSSKFPWWNMDGNEVFGLSDDNVKNPWFEILAWEPFDSIKPDRLLIKRATDDKEITLYRKGTPRK
ncbi:MAG: hypothetical protein FWE86_04970, partial [Oscillospiraceae bacterium]|nr:hypothetical protein [Oscillospiraceae bacterium]